jgi:hypothetical protein
LKNAPWTGRALQKTRTGKLMHLQQRVLVTGGSWLVDFDISIQAGRVIRPRHEPESS